MNPAVWLGSSLVRGCWPLLSPGVSMHRVNYKSRKVVCVRGTVDGKALRVVGAPLMEKPSLLLSTNLLGFLCFLQHFLVV